MAIVIEGGDLYGKTTLAEASGWPIVKFKDIRGVNSTFDISMSINCANLVWDRWWLTEQVYGKLLRGTQGFTDSQLWHLGLHGNSMGTVMLVPYVTLNELHKRYTKRGDDERTFSEVKAIHDAYIQALIMYKDFLPPLTRTLSEALQYHKIIQTRREQLEDLGYNSWGSLQEGGILLVEDESVERPFEANGSYLWHTLMNTSCRPSNTHILSSISKQGRFPNWDKVLEYFKPRAIVAVGKYAFERAKRSGIHCNVIPTPEFREKYVPKDQDLYTLRIERYVTNDCKTGKRTTPVR
jgi:hypothetical protein